MSLLSVLTSAVLPVVAVAGVGYVLGSVRDVNVEPLSTVTIFVLAPALVFYSLLTTPISGSTVARLFGGVVAFTVAIVAIAEGAGRFLGEREPILGAFVLTSTFSNAGNYGIPLSAFAFGALGRSTAVLYIAVQSVLMYTVGVYVASRGQAASMRGALGKVFRLPLVYAVVAAGVVRAFDLAPPTDTAAMETIRLTGEAAIPVMLLMLGIQLAGPVGGATVRRVAPATVLKLLVAPIVALGVALGVGLTGTVGRVFVLECAMPAAVTPLMLTIEFGDGAREFSAADYVSTTILVSTLGSLVTLTALIAVLQSGALL
ncbi:AEC family transporter [Halorientalis brevis]|uniref:AEC family transporter n=1 Tax=Halorientalis brevis TaxID=1126241 RepID=A0ABD6C7B3_9EURY